MNETMDATLGAFVRDIEERSWADVEALARAVSDEHEARTEAVRRQAEQEAEAACQAELAHFSQQLRLAADTRRAQDREKLLACRAECVGEAMEALRERLRAYTASDEYQARLTQLLSRGMDALGTKHGPVTVFLRREDMTRGDILRSTSDGAVITVREGDFAWGGMIVQSDEAGRRVDLTFDTALRGAQSRFAEIFGMEIS